MSMYSLYCGMNDAQAEQARQEREKRSLRRRISDIKARYQRGCWTGKKSVEVLHQEFERSKIWVKIRRHGEKCTSPREQSRSSAQEGNYR